jgi:hypothetical protein
MESSILTEAIRKHSDPVHSGHGFIDRRQKRYDIRS